MTDDLLANGLRERVAVYLAEHFTMSVATVDATPGGMPHAVSVFYVVDGTFNLVFLSKTTSQHAVHIEQWNTQQPSQKEQDAPVAVTVTESYNDWERIQGIQLWGRAHLLSGLARSKALALYVAKFPFVRDMIKQPKLAALIAGIGVYKIVPERIAFTDNTTGMFGREILDLTI